MALPTAVYGSQQVRALDAYAIRELGIPGYALMKRAAESALRALRTRWPTAMRIVVVCGGGNNGGDGFVLARFAQAAGLEVLTLTVVPPEQLQGDARRAYDELLASAGAVQPFEARRLADAEVIVDALLGIGVTGSLRPAAQAAVDAINTTLKPVLALDAPSGLDSDTGQVLSTAVAADTTITFVGLKTGLLLGAGPEHAGVVVCDDLEIEAPERQEFQPRLVRLTEAAIAEALPRRARLAHKGTFGRVLIVGGGPGMPGALRLAGEAALRAGAGLVTVAGAPENLAPVVSGCPELIYASLTSGSDLEAHLERADVVAIGPGLGRTEWARALCDRVFGSQSPLVVDADALNLLAECRVRKRSNWILTPHPGEAARLLDMSIERVQEERIAAVDELVVRYGGVAVLKGAGTLIAGEGARSICERGNPGMATAGMGDVLTGAIAAVLAQCRDLGRAARVGVLVHAIAGDIAARDGQRGLIARDVLRELRASVNR
ncbi:MAG TPA: NAD(P)H-hydrate dehydratase [Steroidobacteraceae bacterium]|nr:NAD(P)H-hydrate dehydratase [Steroidobacteraceae bacterium]HRX91033.1 NAD(P)H-hydrate dehydratase [Steroidobacteraceae bacterium]